jgi:NitT/TauT family transport system substrate-binding protein
MMRFLVLSIAILLLAGCGEKKSQPESGVKLKLALNWFPEAEHGGYYAAEVEGHFKGKNLSVEIQGGGPDAPVIQKVATGRAEYGIANADDVLNARATDAPIVAIFAPIQTNPRCIMVHRSSGIEKIEDISNMTLAMSARPSFSHWLKAKYPLEGVKIVPYPASIAVFLNDPNFAQQAYNISEPFVAKKMGADPKVLMVSDLGFNPYCSVLITTEKRLKDYPEEVEKMVEASYRGWVDYLKKPEATNELIHSKNSEMPLDILAFGVVQLKNMVQSNDKSLKLGQMSEKRWKVLAGQMEEAGLIKLKDEELEKAWRNF